MTSRTFSRAVLIDAPAERVYEALTTARGLTGWWASAATTSGNRVVLDFPEVGERIVMRVVDAVASTHVQWHCDEHTALPEWEGTALRFDIRPQSNGVELRFEHDGLTPLLDCYDDCRRGWEYFLESLAAFASSGRGTPFGS